MRNPARHEKIPGPEEKRTRTHEDPDPGRNRCGCDRDRGVYVAPGLDGADAYEDEDFLDFAETMCMEGLIFHYDYHDAVQHIEDFPDHQHSIEGVLRAVMDDPETFFVPEGCEHEYSEQELKLVMAWQQALLAMKANSEDDPDHQ